MLIVGVHVNGLSESVVYGGLSVSVSVSVLIVMC